MPRKKIERQAARVRADPQTLSRDLARYEMDPNALREFAEVACAIANSFEKHRPAIDDLRSAARDIAASLNHAVVQIEKLRHRVPKLDAIKQTSVLTTANRDADFLDRLLETMAAFATAAGSVFPEPETIRQSRGRHVKLRGWVPATQLALAWLRAFGELPKASNSSPFVAACEYLLPAFGSEFYFAKTGAHVRAALKMFKFDIATK